MNHRQLLYRHFNLLILAALILLSSKAAAQLSENSKKNDSLKKAVVAAVKPEAKVKALLILADFYGGLSEYKYIDSSIISLKRALAICNIINLTEGKVFCLKNLAIRYGELENWSRSRKYYKSVVSLYLSRNDQRNAAYTYWYMANYFRSQPNTNLNMIRESVNCSSNERALFLKLKDSSAAMTSLKDQGDANLYLRNLDSSEYDLNEALKIGRKIHYKNLHEIYYLLACASNLRGDFHKTLDFRLKTISSMVAAGDTNDRWLFYEGLANTYQMLHQYDQSLFYYKLCLSFYSNKIIPVFLIEDMLIESGQNAKAISFIRKQISYLHPETDKDISIYNAILGNYAMALGDDQKAESFYLKMVNFNNGNLSNAGWPSELMLTNYRIITNFYIRTKKFKKAAFYEQKMDFIPKFNISEFVLSQIELIKFKVDSGNHQYVFAIQHYQMHKRMLDSMFTYSKSRQISDLEIKYATAQKDKDIQLLKKQSQFENERYSKKAAVTEYLILSLVLLAIVLTVLYSRSRLRRKSLLLLKEKQKEIVGKNTALEQLVKDNEWLLREVHHRVKNNLHTIMSLLRSQSEFLKDEIALNAVLDSQHRVHAMALIHQKLYKAEHSTAIYMPEYIGELVEYLRLSFATGKRIIFSLYIEPVYLDVGIAVPVGLILNEAITNSLKYAFSDQEFGEITIELTTDNMIVHLLVSDDGIGLPEEFNPETSESFGMRLLRGLVSDDLDGSFELMNNHGTTVVMSFEINAEV